MKVPFNKVYSLLAVLGLAMFLPLLTQATDINLSTMQVKMIGEEMTDSAGVSVDSAGDVNGDGYDDILVGAPYDDIGGASAGAAYIIYGSKTLSSSIDLSTANVKIIGEWVFDQAGYTVSAAGDVNNDGYDDVLVGTGYNWSGSNPGYAYLIYGSNSLASTIDLSTANVKFTGENNGDMAGTAVSAAGDVNHDGFDDILIGAYWNDAGGSNSGAAYLVYGSNSLSSSISLSAANVKFIGEDINDAAGITVSSAGDVNNDNYDDILIGAFHNNVNGAAYLVYGSNSLATSIDLSAANVKFLSEASGASSAGMGLSAAGDVNNDGYDDVLIGDYASDGVGVGADSGAAYLIYGANILPASMNLSAANVKFSGETLQDYAGESISSAGDVNHDGYDDLLIGAQGYDNGSTNRLFDSGATYLIYGSNSLTSKNLSTADIRLIGEEYGDYAGRSVASAGDVNNDGYDDILVGASGEDTGGSGAGMVYLGYVNKDNDGDGMLGADGLIAGPDCNDNDATLTTARSFYIDTDRDGYGSAITGTICSNTPTAGYSTNNTDCNDGDSTINANQMYYQDEDGDSLGDPDHTILACQNTAPTGYAANKLDENDDKESEVQQYEDDSDLYFSVANSGKFLSFMDFASNTVLNTIRLSKTKKYSINKIRLLSFKNKDFIVVTSKSKSDVLLSLVKIDISASKLTIKDQKKTTNINIKPSKTKITGHTINLKNKNSEILEKYLVSNKYKLILQN